MLTSIAPVEPSGGLLSEMCAIINVLEGFLRGYIGAMLVLRSDGCELAIVSNSWKVDFCDNSNEISMILKWAMKNIENPELSIVLKPLFLQRFSHVFQGVRDSDEH